MYFYFFSFRFCSLAPPAKYHLVSLCLKKQAEIFWAHLSKTWQLTPKQCRYINRTTGRERYTYAKNAISRTFLVPLLLESPAVWLSDSRTVL